MPGARQPQPASSSDVEHLLRKGKWLHRMIQGDEREALEVMREDRRYEHKDTSQSKWTDPRALRDNGWNSGKHHVMWQTWGVNAMLQELDTPAHESDKDVKIENTAGGSYCQVIKLRDGLIMPYYIFSPAEEARTHRQPDPRVALHSYSDILFLEYKKMADRAGASIRELKYICFHNVENAQTWALVLKLFDRRGKLEHVRGHRPQIELYSFRHAERFSMNSDRDAVLALLGTPLGATVAWLLIQHKRYFAGKDIRSVYIFRASHMSNHDNLYPYTGILFKIDTASSRSSSGHR